MKAKARKIFGSHPELKRVIGFSDYVQVHFTLGATISKDDIERMKCDYQITANCINEEFIQIIEFFGDDFTE